MKSLVGVSGSTRPAATIDPFNKLVTFTAAQHDQGHIPLIISSIPDIPDRTDALIHRGHSPLPAMRDYMHELKGADAGCIVIPCNTAHFWFNELGECCHTELPGIVETTMNEVKNCGKSRIGLLATNATLCVGLYQKGVESLGLTCISPDSSDQGKAIEGIYCLRVGDLKRVQMLMNEQVEVLFSHGAQIIVLGCTEIPVTLTGVIRKSPDECIDSTGSLVRAGIRRYEKRVGKHHFLAQ